VNLQNLQNFQNLPSNLTSSNSTPSIPGFAAPNTPSAIGPLGTPDANANPDLRLQAAQQQITTAGVAVSQAAQLNQQNALTSQSLVTGNTQLQQLSVDSISSRLGVPVQALVRLAADHLVWVLEQVRDPGAYVASEGTTLADMIQTAGGVSRAADLSSVEVTSTQIDPLLGTSRTLRTNYKGQQGDFQKVTLEPLDVIRLRPVFSDRENGQVSVLGQVRYPGAFDITRGERLSSLLERSGGLTDQAYPYGAVFTRERAALAEREGNIRQGRAIDAQLATVASLRTDTGNNGDRLAFLNTLAQQVRNEPVLGRITVTSDLAVLRVRPELDIVLEPGDTLYIPPRPSTVTVSGEVLNAGSFQYQAGLQVRDYLTLAGGITQGADSDRIFVILPDGTAHAAEESWLTFGNTNFIPPGSTIVVPRDLRPLDLNQFLRDAVQITSQLAVAGASIAVIGR
jgi:protein involved in polysaccharide export with SLBB domain